MCLIVFDYLFRYKVQSCSSYLHVAIQYKIMLSTWPICETGCCYKPHRIMYTVSTCIDSVGNIVTAKVTGRLHFVA